jgi:hypothetical protein
VLSKIQWWWCLSLLAGVLVAPGSVHAWKPYTHNFAATETLRGVDFSRHTVLINGKPYEVDPRVTSAIQACPACYHAGVVGPDGFPDISFGQAVIHPKKVGTWMRELLKAAWAAQRSQSYTPFEKQQILAFTYGYLAHAAGDLWAHTLVNELSHDVHPSLEDMLADPSKAGVALRHTILESAVLDATPGYDTNPERSVAPGGYGQTQGDVSTKSTPGTEYDAPPGRFIYDALIKETQMLGVDGVPNAEPGTFRDARGPLLGGFLEMRHYLNAHLENVPDPVQEAVDAYNNRVAAFMALEEACDFDEPSDFEDCREGLLALGYGIVLGNIEAFWAFVTAELEVLARAVLDAYLAAWVSDLDAGLYNWSELGLATTQGLFDAQTFRNHQNAKCIHNGPESLPPELPNLRDECEDDVTIPHVLLAKANPFINEYGLSMLGLPDLVGEVREAVGLIEPEFQSILVDLGLTFNPLDPLVQLEQAFQELILVVIAEVLLIDVETLGEFLESPAQYVCLEQGQFSLPYIGQVDIPLFTQQEHARLDDYLGLSGRPHHVQEEGLPLACGRLEDTAEFDPQGVSAIRNLITMGRLVLLNGKQLNAVLKDLLGREINTYGTFEEFPANVMVDALAAEHSQMRNEPYLWSIDVDHGWRENGWPVFALERPADKQSGSGKFPLWESCALRPAFRKLFQDWENPWEGRAPLPGMELDHFPEGPAELGFRDVPSEDPTNDPEPPVSHLDRQGGFKEGDLHYVPASHTFTLTATDGPDLKGFPASELGIQYRIRQPSLPTPDWTKAPQSAPITLVGPDGRYFIDHHSEDPCHTFDVSVGQPEAVKTAEVILDTTPPVTACLRPPFGQVFETDGVSSANFTVEDPGAGVANISATLDGMVDAAGPVPIGQGARIDMFNLLPGVRTVSVTATDRLSHTSTTACTFELRVTSRSLISNLERFYLAGQIDGTVYHALNVKLQGAQQAHLRGNHRSELNVIGAFTHQLEAQRGKKVHEKAARQLLIYAQDLITRGG